MRLSHQPKGSTLAKRSPKSSGAAAFYGLLLLTLAVAIPYGTVDPWAKGSFVVAASILAALRVISGLLDRRFRFASVGLLLPLVGVLALAVLQVIPVTSTGAVISLDPYETKTFILVFGSLIVCYEALLALTTSPGRLRLLVAAVFAVGFASAIFGIVRDATATTAWDIFSQYVQADQSYAQFINRNHFATLAEMTLGLMIGILLKAEIRNGVKFAGWLSVAVLMYSVIDSSSRGGILSATGLILFAVFVHVLTRSRRTTRRGRQVEDEPTYFRRLAGAAAFCILLFGLIAFVVAFVGGDRIVTRFERIEGETQTTDSSRVSRALIWKSTSDLIRTHPITGIGFGAYEAGFTRFYGSDGEFRVSQAHNEYLEILANGGLVGFGLFAVFAVLATARIVHNVRSMDRFRAACCFGSAIGIFGVLIHSLVDFGLHIIVNAYVLVLLLTIATAVIPEVRRDDDRRNRRVV